RRAAVPDRPARVGRAADGIRSRCEFNRAEAAQRRRRVEYARVVGVEAQRRADGGAACGADTGDRADVENAGLRDNLAAAAGADRDSNLSREAAAALHDRAVVRDDRPRETVEEDAASIALKVDGAVIDEVSAVL